MVSVIMPAYKAEKTIAESVESVIAQTYADWELLIVFDGEICAVPQDSRIRIVKNIEKRGVAGSRMRGVELAEGEWIAFLDADDTMREDKLEKQLAFMRETNAEISYTASAFFDSGYILPAVKELRYDELLRRNLVSCSSVMVKRELMLKHPMPSGLISEDYAAWLRICREVGVIYGLDEPLLKYRVSARSSSSNKIGMAIKTWAAYMYAGHNPVTAGFYMLRYIGWSLRKRKMMIAPQQKSQEATDENTAGAGQFIH